MWKKRHLLFWALYKPLKILAAKAKRGTSGIEFFLSELKEVYFIYRKVNLTFTLCSVITNLVSTTDRNLKVERNGMGEEEEERIKYSCLRKLGLSRDQWRVMEEIEVWVYNLKKKVIRWRYYNSWKEERGLGSV